METRGSKEIADRRIMYVGNRIDNGRDSIEEKEGREVEGKGLKDKKDGWEGRVKGEGGMDREGRELGWG